MNTRTASFLPRLVQFLLLLLAGALLAKADPTVIFSTVRLNGRAFSNVVFQMTPIQLVTQSNSILLPFSYSNITDSAGNFIVSNCVPTSYRTTARYQNGIATWTNCVEAGDGVVYAGYTGAAFCGASPTNGLIAYSTAQADALFALRTNAIRMQTNGVSVAAGFTNLNWASGVTGYLSGATLVLGVSSAGSSVDTNAFQPASATLTNLSGTGALTNSAAFQPANTTLSNIANSTTLVVTNSKVGIGTNTPDATLEVQGSARFSRGITNTAGFSFASGAVVSDAAGAVTSTGQIAGNDLRAAANRFVFWLSGGAMKSPASDTVQILNGGFSAMGALNASNVSAITLSATNGVSIYASAVSPAAPSAQGAFLWTDGTNLNVTLRNGGGTITTNKLTMSAWP